MLTRRSFSLLGAGFAAATWAGLPYDPALAAAGRTVRFKDGAVVPALGQGSWHLGQGRHPLAAEEDAMTLGISLGLTVLDTAELYGSGRAEAMIAQVIAGQRDRVFVVSKVMPSHATASGIKRACAGSLSRLKTDHLDLYLLHWRDGILDLAEVVDTFEGLRDAGKIRRWGVSNFGVRDMEELFQVPNGAHCAANQVVYSLANRDIERDLLPWCTQHGMPIMAYSPLGGSGSDLLRNQALNAVATAHGQSPSAVALAWTMRGGNAISIPESGSADHVRENAAALSLDLTPQDLQALDTAFPA